MKCNDSSGEYYTARVVGVYDGRDFDASQNPNNSNDVRYYVVGGGGALYMVNWVKEIANSNGWGTVYAKIRAGKYPTSIDDFAAVGVWSPDNYRGI